MEVVLALEGAGDAEHPASSNGRPRICRPMGSAALGEAARHAQAGKPGEVAGSVKMSLRYIASGSSIFSPSRNAGVGDVGRADDVDLAEGARRSRAG